MMQPIDYVCYACGAKPGQPCVARDGKKLVDEHRERKILVPSKLCQKTRLKRAIECWVKAQERLRESKRENRELANENKRLRRLLKTYDLHTMSAVYRKLDDAEDEITRLQLALKEAQEPSSPPPVGPLRLVTPR